MSDSFPSPGNQGSQNSCTAWAIGYAYKTFQERQDHNWDKIDSTSRQFSPSYIYNQICEGKDNGSTFEDAFDILIDQGVCTLADMKYSQYDYKTQPTAAQKQKAAAHKASEYNYIDAGDFDSIKHALTNNDTVVIRVPIYPDLDKLKSSNPIYNSSSGKLRGYHALCLVGYDDTKQAFKFINSWGTSWGLKGYGYISYDLMIEFSEDSFVMTDKIENTMKVNNIRYDDSSENFIWDSVPEAESYEVKMNGKNGTTATNSYGSIGNVNEDNEIQVRAVDKTTDSYSDWKSKSFFLGKYGDVDLDGAVTEEDSLMVLKYAAAKIELSDNQRILADVDGDGHIDSGDAILIQKYKAGIITEFSVGNYVIFFEELYGDVNMDGVITEDDSNMILNYYVEEIELSDKQLIIADVNGDGEVNPADSLNIRQFVEGLISEFPVGKYATIHE